MAVNITEQTVSQIIKKRPQESHKGSFGTLQLFCGSKLMSGAPYLAAMGALRTGVGLAVVSAKEPLRKILMSRLTEPVFSGIKISPRATAFTVGCGSTDNAKIVKKLLKFNLPCVIDADAINYLAKHTDLLEKPHCSAVLTPHMAEMSRLMRIPIEEISKNREETALKAAKRFSSVVVLKGHNTVIATPNGDIFVNTTGNSGLAKGGSGDVLAGIIGSFLAQGYTPTEAAIIGVWLHGAAADSLKESTSEYGILPSDIPYEAGKILKRFE